MEGLYSEIDEAEAEVVVETEDEEAKDDGNAGAVGGGDNEVIEE